MNRKKIWWMVGLALLVESGLMLLPIVAGLCFGERPGAYMISALITAAAGFLLSRLRSADDTIYARDGFVTVTLVWLVMSAFGALPFVLSGDIPSYVDAFFETMSGLTTTGASILNNIEGLSKASLFWRSFTHWIGGMGVLVFMMAVLPMSGEHSMHIMRAEVPGPVVGKLVPRAGETAKILYYIYGALTAAETLFLWFGGMSFFEALLHAFATAGTGGFSTRNSSVAAFNSPYVETVIALFLIPLVYCSDLHYHRCNCSRHIRHIRKCVGYGSERFLQCDDDYEHGRVLHGGFHHVAAVHPGADCAADVYRRMRRQHGRRTEALQGDAAGEKRRDRCQADGIAETRQAGENGREMRIRQRSDDGGNVFLPVYSDSADLHVCGVV